MSNKKLVTVLLLSLVMGIPLFGCDKDKKGASNDIDTNQIDEGTDPDINTDSHTENGSTDKPPEFVDKAEAGAKNIALDAHGNIYIAGSTFNDDWVGPLEELPLHGYGFCTSGSSFTPEIFVMKLNPAGEYLWHTIYGDACDGDSDAWTLHTYAEGLEVDNNGNVYVSGISRESWPGDNGIRPIQEKTLSGYAAYVLKLNTNGEYQWHTFYEDSSSSAWNVTLDLTSEGDVIIAGQVEGSLVGPNDIEPLNEINNAEGRGENIFILKLDSEGTYQWHTFYGSAGNDHAGNVALDNADNIYISGASFQSWLGYDDQEPLSAFTPGARNEENIFVLKLNRNGQYQWHGFYGSDRQDFGGSLCVDSQNNELVVVGLASNAWSGPEGQVPLSRTDTTEAYIMKLSTEGEYQWHTFFNGADNGMGNFVAITSTLLVHCAIGPSGNIYVSGMSERSWNGPGGKVPIHSFRTPFISLSNYTNIFVMKYLDGGTYQWHTFYGSAYKDTTHSPVALDDNENIYVAGYSESDWNTDGNDEPLNTTAGTKDAMVLKLDNDGNYLFHTFYGKSPAR